MSTNEIITRPAVIEDTEEIVKMHRSLAEYCGYDMDRFRIAERQVADTIANQDAWAKYFIAEGDLAPGYRAIAGMIYASRTPTFAWSGAPKVYVEDLYVKEKFRNFGVGKWLVAEVCHLALEYADGNEDSSCVSLDTMNHSNDTTLKFYDGLGFTSHNSNLRLSGEPLAQLAERALLAHHNFNDILDS
jgi:GNAT superfamily N-acetyltransferase